MSTKYSDLFARLVEPFHPDDVKVRSYDNARYITARSVSNRLDDVLGPENWWDEYERWGDNAVLCKLTLRLVNGDTVTKADVGANSTMAAKQGGKADPGEDDKGGASDAFKRAAVKFGIGRYLYNDGYVNFGATAALSHDPAPPTRAVAALPAPDGLSRVQRFVAWCADNGHTQRATALAQSNFKCKLEQVTEANAEFIHNIIKVATRGNVSAAAAPPAETRAAVAPRPPQGAVNENGAPVKFGWPHTGASLFAWIKNLERAYQEDLVSRVNREFDGKFPRSMTREWNADQIEQGALFVARIIKALPGYDGQFDDKLPDLAEMKAALVDKAKAVLANGGSPDPTYAEIGAYLDVVAKDLAAFGGELVGDLEACVNEGLLKAVLADVDKDLNDGSDIPF